MNAKVKTLNPEEMLNSFMDSGYKRSQIFKKDFEHFYISSLADLREISNHPVPPIRSKTHTILFLQKGALKMKIGSHSITIRANQCAVIPAGQVFSYDEKDDAKSISASGYICGFNVPFIVSDIGTTDFIKKLDFLTLWANPYIELSESSAQYVCHMLVRMQKEYREKGLENKLIVQASLIAILCDLNADYKPLADHQNKLAVELTMRFKELTQKNLSRTHRVSDYANMLHVSPNHLSRSVKLVSGISPSAWIRETILNEAKALLSQTNLSVQEVASELGVYDQSYFSRIFKKREGITPMDFRNQLCD
jgi:AraC-like DNA-binding protein/mannose-6-phosphate isomerase-like protein (cupin superfamily)